MSGDAGDDFIEETKRTIMEIMQYMRYASMGHQGGGHGGFPELNRHSKSKDKNQSDRPERAKLEGIEKEADLPALQERPDMIVVANNVDDAQFLASVMNRNKLEYTLLKERGDGAFVFTLPDRDRLDEISIHAPFSKVDHIIKPSENPHTTLREMADINPDVISLLKQFEIKRPNAILADAQDSPFMHEAHKVAFVPGAPENFKFDFPTVEWDRDAEILTDFFDQKGIPYTMLHLDQETVQFSFHPDSAKDVKNVVDFHLNHEPSKMHMGRFPDYEALENPAKRIGAEDFGFTTTGAQSQNTPATSPQTLKNVEDEVLSVTVDDAVNAQILKDNLSQERIAYESFKEKATGAERFVVSKKELVRNADKLDAISERIENMTSRNVVNAQEKARVAQTNNKSAKTKAAKQKEVPSKKTRGFSTEQRHTPVQDEKVAKRSAASRNTSQMKQRKQIKGK